MGDFLRSIAILTVLLIPLVAATKDAEFKFECFKNHKNYKGKKKLFSTTLYSSKTFHNLILIDANHLINLF